MIRVQDDLEKLSSEAAELFADRARRAVEARGRFCVALSGGSTPRRTYELLGQAPLRQKIPWSRVHVFWGDERCVPQNDRRSNVRMAREALLDSLALSPHQIHPMVCLEDPEAGALAYQGQLADFFFPAEPRFDLVLLGLGRDGHTASLIPAAGVPLQSERLVLPVRVPGEEFSRISLSLSALNRTRMALFLVSGGEKKDILHQVLHGPPGRFPAQFVAPNQGEVRWLVDRAAAGEDEVPEP